MPRTVPARLSPLVVVAVAAAVIRSFLVRTAGLHPASALHLTAARSLLPPSGVPAWADVAAAAAAAACAALVARSGGPDARLSLIDALAATLMGAFAAVACNLASVLFGSFAVGLAGGIVAGAMIALVRKAAALFRTTVPPPILRDFAAIGAGSGLRLGSCVAVGAGLIAGMPAGAAYGIAAFVGLAAGLPAAFLLFKAVSAAFR